MGQQEALVLQEKNLAFGERLATTKVKFSQVFGLL